MTNNNRISFPEKLKNDIKNKFRSVSRFCKITNENYDVLRQQMSKGTTNKKIDRIYRLYKITNNIPIHGEITEALRTRIRKNKKEVIHYCKENGIYQSLISKVLSGDIKKINNHIEDIIRDVL